jgi:ABC-2 type transport system ATP-binding protein
MKGVYCVEKKNQCLSFQVDSRELGNVISYVSGFGIVKLESAPPTLEDLFMRHYKDEGGAL